MYPEFSIHVRHENRPLLDKVANGLKAHAWVYELPAGMATVYKSPVAPLRGFVVCADIGQKENVKKCVDGGCPLDVFHGSVAFIEIYSDKIFVNQEAPKPIVDAVAELLGPVLKGGGWRADARGGELPAEIYENPRLLFT